MSGDTNESNGTDDANQEDHPAPLSDLAEAVAQRSGQADMDPLQDLFEKQPFHQVDSDELWTDSSEGYASAANSIDGVERDGENIYTIPKRDFCETCRHFSKPPQIKCNHEGTAILEFVDMDHVRVSACPVVEEQIDIESREF